MPNVSASSFTGIFNDYGNDTGSDGLFNFLTIGAEVNIDASKDYMIYGRLEDSQGNFFEYNNCRSLPLGKYIFILDFDGLKLYIPDTGEGPGPQKIDINRAEVWLLKALPGIGETLAQRIVDYRRQNGPFQNTRELTGVSGIGDSTYEQIEHLITVAGMRSTIPA